MGICEKSNMKYNVSVFLPKGAKGTSEVTQTAQFILRGLILVLGGKMVISLNIIEKWLK